ncbi:MAG: iron-sulfur cluster repair protein YtfE [Alphaproteobacteria bacterium]
MTLTYPELPMRDRPIGDIAATLPGATAVFRKFKLDFCCGGDVALGVSARRRGVDVAAIEDELAKLRLAEQADTVPAETPALIQHILTRYHDTHRRELPELIQLARKVEAVHDGHPQAPYGLAEHLRQIAGELEVHMKKEELILFPAMGRVAGGLDGPITQMRHEHDGHGEQLRRLEEIVHGFALPDDACRSWRALYAGAHKLVDDVMEHIHLENNVLFPRFELAKAD